MTEPVGVPVNPHPVDHVDHTYTSTACHHQLHSQCRVLCKYCESICVCECHVGQENVE